MINYIDKFKLTNKTILINGGFGLLGWEISLACLSVCGKIIITDINENKLKNLKKLSSIYKNKFQFFKIDTSNYKTIEKNFNKIKKYNPKIDVFINASYPKDKHWNKNTFENNNLESFRKNIDMHMISFGWLPRLIAENMKKQKIKGNIILLGSIYGLNGQDLSIYRKTKMKENMTYSIVKGAVVNLTRLMSSYYGKYNIRVNAICPGGVILNQNKIFIKNYSNKVPLKRLAKKSEIASSTIFLASEASSYITGSAFIVDGGWTSI